MKSSLELQQLFIIDEDGYLAWKDSFPAHSFEDPLRVLLRGYPFEPPAVPTVDSFNPPNEMTRVGDRVYSIPNEDTGYKGLLRLSQLFPEFLNKPFEQILMIGSISYYGLHELIEWLKLHNSETAEITIVDSSESIVNLLFFLYQQDFFLTNNKINFVMQDIVEYSPTNNLT